MTNILKVHGKLPPEQNTLWKTAPYPNPNHNPNPNPVVDLFWGQSFRGGHAFCTLSRSY